MSPVPNILQQLVKNLSRLRYFTLILLAIVVLALAGVGLYMVTHPGAAPPPASDSEPSPADKPVVAEPVVPEPFNPVVGLYTGRGSWGPDLEAMENFLSRYELESVEIDEESLNSDELSDLCDLLVFVGGFSAEYLHYVGKHSNIRTFVEEGGSFVGFCAGAYYASSTMVWRGKELDYPLKLFSGEAAGPLSIGWGSQTTTELNPALSFNQDFGESIEMWYFDGPCFTDLDEEKIDVLARYRFNGEAAVIAFNLGRGRVLLSGPHPELGYVPAEERLDTEGGSGAQWPWLYAAIRWSVTGEEKI